MRTTALRVSFERLLHDVTPVHPSHPSKVWKGPTLDVMPSLCQKVQAAVTKDGVISKHFDAVVAFIPVEVKGQPNGSILEISDSLKDILAPAGLEVVKAEPNRDKKGEFLFVVDAMRAPAPAA